ncbi:MAG: hypothetical protein Q7J85_07865 [Bacillota bacterium]|nr:hypothetical protein [Bacillota bacterium]
MAQNPWVKLAVLSFAGIVLSFGILWGINQYNGYNGINANYRYNMNMQGMPQGQNWTNGNMNNMYRSGMQQGQNWINQTNNMPMQGMQQGQNWMNNGMNAGNMYMQGMPQGQNWMNQGMNMMPMSGGMSMMQR